MAQNELKNRARFSTTIRFETERALKEYSKETGVPISKIVDKAIRQYLESKGNT